MAIPRNHLRVLPEERRNQLRLKSATEYSGLVTFDDNTEVKAVLSSPANGTILINVPKPSSGKNVEKIQFTKHFTLECSDDWSFQEKRPGSSGETFVLINKNKKYLDTFEDLVPPELFLHKSHYNILNLEIPENLSELVSILTLIKDCSVPIEASIRSGGTAIPVKFNFSANSSDFGRLDLGISQENALRIKGHGFLDFNFLSVRYLLKIDLGEYDQDFSVVTATVGAVHLAISGRIYDRYACDRKLSVVHENGSFEATMIEISPEGGALSVPPSHASGLLKFETFYLDDSVIRVPFRVRGSKNTTDGSCVLRISFLKDVSNSSLDLSKFFFRTLSGPSVARNLENHDLLIDLYESVGYGPKEGISLASWKNKSKGVWRNLDSRLLGNCVLYLDSSKKAHVSVGVLPFSKRTIYSHSLASSQSLEGALGLSEQMILTQAWLSFFPDVEYYSGSYRKTSRLSTRLHASFSSGLKPLNQVIMHSRTWWNPSILSVNSDLYSFETVETLPDTSVETFSEEGRRLIQCLSGTPDIDIDNHKIRYVVLYDKTRGDQVGIAVLHSYQDLTSATNFLNHSFLIPLKRGLNLTELNACLVSYLKKVEGDGSLSRASIVLGEGPINTEFPSSQVDREQDYREVFWTFTPREDLNCLNISLARASYNLCRKYGNNGVEAYAKTTLFN